MTQAQTPDELLEFVLNKARTAGASDADARYGRSEGVNVDVRGGKLESVERDESVSLSLRCFFGQRQAHVASSDTRLESLETIIERCVAMAKVAPEDPYCGLAPAEHLAEEWPKLDLDGDGPIDTDVMEQAAKEAEAAALAIEGVQQVSSCGYGWSRGESWLAATNGFSAYKSGGSSGIGLAAVAMRDGAMERDYESWTTRRLQDRPSALDIGREAGERAIKRLGSRKVVSGKFPVIYDGRVSASLISSFIGAIAGPSIARGVSFLKDRMGNKIFADGIDILDDPFLAFGMASRSFDGEGRPVAPSKLIDNGVLTRWLLNGSSAKQLGLNPNGFASTAFGDPPGVRPSNVHLAPGDLDQSGLMKTAGTGLLVTEMFGPSINPNTGDYSVGVAGQWFENGEIAYPVSEVTIASDLPSMYARLVPGSDLEFRGATNAPSVLIDGMTLAGT